MKGGRMLRRVDNDYDDLDDDDLDDDDFEEERGGFGDIAKKLNLVTDAKKSAKKVAEQSAKAKETLKDAAEFQRMMEKAKEIVYKNN
ncbi:hypothetical protein P3T76_015055 [Phytophthora citrophthora]|uniref:Uncharacterized protein n=1 Tax=Phytophthora citrophthora TaxID=4793 RepID=A0AAD9G0Y8_9STRA|nr:hypothetical protein P3T76_015055 [Phytophthora citrophthora]